MCLSIFMGGLYVLAYRSNHLQGKKQHTWSQTSKEPEASNGLEEILSEPVWNPKEHQIGAFKSFWVLLCQFGKGLASLEIYSGRFPPWPMSVTAKSDRPYPKAHNDNRQPFVHHMRSFKSYTEGFPTRNGLHLLYDDF